MYTKILIVENTGKSQNIQRKRQTVTLPTTVGPFKRGARSIVSDRGNAHNMTLSEKRKFSNSVYSRIAT